MLTSVMGRDSGRTGPGAPSLSHAEKELGSVEPGKLADLVAFRRNPLDDVSVLATAPELVMKGGVVVAGGGTGGKGTAR